MAQWLTWWPLAPLLVLPLAGEILVLRSGPGGSRRLLLLVPALWLLPLLACLLFTNHRGFEAFNAGLLWACIGGWAVQVGLAFYVGWRGRQARRVTALSVCLNIPATALTILALGEGAAGASF